MGKLFYSNLLLFIVLTSNSLQATPAIIPMPNKIQAKEGSFLYPKGFDLKIIRGDDVTKQIFKLLTDSVKNRKINVVPFSNTAISLNLLATSKNDTPTDAYTLSINPNNININANSNAGLFYGVQSLLQLLRADSTKNLSCMEISDSPVFAYRGMHLDVAHQFFDISIIKKYIDVMSALKLNQFIWQIAENTNWRIALKSHPSFTNKTSNYTTEQVKEIIKYAQDRFINVIPAIRFSTPITDTTYNNKALADEICNLFPSTFIQISSNNPTDSLSYFLKQKNKKIIAIDKKTNNKDILLSYKNSKTGWSDAKKGETVIMAPRQYCSLDYYQDWDDEKQAFEMTLLPLNVAYSFRPEGKIKDTATIKHIIGAQAFLYTTYIKNEAALNYQAFPRLLALAECFWTANQNKNFKDFEVRLKTLKNYFYKEIDLPKIDMVRIKPKQ